MKTFTLGELAVMKYGKLPPAEILDAGCPIFTGYRVSGYAKACLYEDPMLVVVARGVGGTGDVKLSPARSWITNLSIVLDLDEQKANKQFMCYFLGQQSLKEKLNTGSAQAQITVNALSTFQVTIPALPMQRRIASILSAYDDLIENNTRRIAILEEMARRIYEEWFVRFRFPGHETVPVVESELGLVPQGWRFQSLFEFGEVITGKTPSKANPDFYGNDVPFLKTPDMHGNMFILATGEGLSAQGAASQRNKTIPIGSLCVSCIGTIGVVAITTGPCQTNQQINSLVLTDKAALEFLFYRIKDSKKTLENLGANGATMGNVNKSKFEALPVLAPPPKLVDSFHKQTAPTFALIEKLARKNANLRTTRDLLLPKLISGELDVSALPAPETVAA